MSPFARLFLPVVVTCIAVSNPARAADPMGPQASAAELEAFFDGLISKQLSDLGIAGATLSVVRGGEVVLAKGYGFADVSGKVPVDPARTLFRIGSVTKLFTWTAVMQLVEEGRLDLDADISQYLGFPVPATYPQPITLRHLMTHTAGFEDDMRDVFSTRPDAVAPLGAWVRANMPARIRPPGVLAAYSNYGTALAGYIVERTAGMPWDDYVETRILRPLGMEHTTGRQPLPAALAGDMSKTYARRGETFEEQPWEILTAMAPAGSISASATDMARFMIAQLALGKAGEARILQEETARRMQSVHFEHDPRLPGMCLGFYEKHRGPRVIGHDGGTIFFHTMLALFPEHDLGVFVSYNTNTAGQLAFGPVLHAFIDALFGPPPPLTASGRVDPAVLGHYRPTRRSVTTFQRVLALGMTVPLGEDDGRLVAPTPLGTFRMVQVEPGLFREENGRHVLAFRLGEDGRATHSFLGVAPMMALERAPWHGTPALHLPFLGGGLLLFVGVLLAAPVRTWLRRRKAQAQPPVLVGARISLLLAALMNVAFVVVLAVAGSNLWELMTRPTTTLAVALTFPVLGAVCVAALTVATALLWARGAGTRWTRLRYTATTLLAVLFVASLQYWNVLGWHL